MKAGESEQGSTTENYRLGWVNFGRRWWVNFQSRLTEQSPTLKNMHSQLAVLVKEFSHLMEDTARAMEDARIWQQGSGSMLTTPFRSRKKQFYGIETTSVAWESASSGDVVSDLTFNGFNVTSST